MPPTSLRTLPPRTQNNKPIDPLQTIIDERRKDAERLFGVTATFNRVEHVVEQIGRDALDVTAYVFDIAGYDGATQCSVWTEPGADGTPLHYAVAHVGKIDSPTMAVKASFLKTR